MTKGQTNRMMAYLSKKMIACDEASFLISLREDSRLGFRRWFQLRMHLLTCHLCRKYAHQIGELSISMEVYREECSHESKRKQLSPEAGARIGKRVSRELNAK
jgi:hypothetical protein